ncbi:MAG: fused MFS/spermidine synthase [Planctomycetes bacterium]|nr:fused MFS/spermidine synthase [Planctomycetota bacterium]
MGCRRPILLGIAGRTVLLVAAVLAFACSGPDEPRAPSPGTGPDAGASGPASPGQDGVVHECRSQFGHIRVRDRGTLRSLIFVRDDGKEAVETTIDRDSPGSLVHPYTRTMMASYLFRPEQERALLVGLGGGAMVLFLRRFEPELAIDAVEIDPEVARIAREYFGVGPDERTEVIVEDAFAYVERTARRYDAIYMDAFLKPSEETDSTGVPLTLKTIAFYRTLQGLLREGGLVVFNLNRGEHTPRDVDTIRRAFARTYVFPVSERGNLIVVASTVPERATRGELLERAEGLDRDARAGFSFRELVGRLEDN